jgi:hypothetical protein
MQCNNSMNSNKGPGFNMGCIPTLFLQRRPELICIYSVEKHSGAAVEGTYPGYVAEMTQHTHVRVDIDPYYNKMVAT